MGQMQETATQKRGDGTERERILSLLRRNEIGGRECALALSQLMDGRIAALADLHLAPCTDLALAAIGGYGRRELCPFSDIDLLILTPPRTSPEARQSVEALLYALWDAGLKVGHAVRTVSDCIEMSRADMMVLTSLLDARLLWGGEKLFRDMAAALRRDISGKRRRRAFSRAKLEERDTRHKRLGDSRYMLEPNIKDGKGGLRDYQTLFWIADALYGARTPQDLVAPDILTRREARQFRRAHDYLLTVRCHLHDLAGRAEERLHFDIQPALAKRLGYAERDNAKAVERFMKHYFLTTRDIGTLTRIVCAAIEESEERQKEKSGRVSGFKIVNGRLSFPPSLDLRERPVEMVRLFRVAQETRHDIHPFAIREITKNLSAIDRKLCQDPLANSVFMDILLDPKDAAATLRRMSEAGILGRFIPAFGKVIALMQFDRYHVFTVDEHTLHTIRILHEIENGTRSDQSPLAGRIVREVPQRRVLYVAMMLHDICKGLGGDHSLLGAELALKLCPRLGLNDQETRLVSWLVFDHLLLSHTAFRRDLEDPKTIRDFVFRVYDVERLKLLTVLTTADIMAVGPECWTGWKSRLIENLYVRAYAALKGEAVPEGGIVRPPEDYRQGETRIDILNDPEEHATNVTIYTPDRAGLFATLAGALSAAGANIIQARIGTTAGGTAADSFLVQNLSGHAFEKKWRLDEIRKTVLDALEGTLDIEAGIARHALQPVRKDEVFDIRPKIRINGKASETHTVVEISARDRPGLLYALTCALRDEGLSIASAKIMTQGLKAVDVFYVTDCQGNKISERDIDSLKVSLKQVIS